MWEGLILDWFSLISVKLPSDCNFIPLRRISSREDCVSQHNSFRQDEAVERSRALNQKEQVLFDILQLIRSWRAKEGGRRQWQSQVLFYCALIKCQVLFLVLDTHYVLELLCLYHTGETKVIHLLMIWVILKLDVWLQIHSLC